MDKELIFENENIKIYICKDADLYELNRAELDQLCHYYRGKVLKARTDFARERAFASGLLLKDYLGIDKETEVKITEFGMPFVEGKYFSISHDEGYTILAVSEDGIGADIEKIQPISPAVIEKLFPEEYLKKINEGDSSNREESMISLWTQTEAILKAKGMGFHEDVRNNKNWREGYYAFTFKWEDFMISYAVEEPQNN